MVRLVEQPITLTIGRATSRVDPLKPVNLDTHTTPDNRGNLGIQDNLARSLEYRGARAQVNLVEVNKTNNPSLSRTRGKAHINLTVNSKI